MCMSENELIAQTEKTFEDIKHVDENGNEYWYARELQIALQYSEWRKFEGVIEKTKDACKNSNINVLDHFVGANKIVEAGATNKRIKEYILTRYGCYLIAQNRDARKKTLSKKSNKKRKLFT